MSKLDRSGSRARFERFARRAKLVAFGCAAVLVFPAVSSGVEEQVAAMDPGDIGRSGCTVSMGARDARGIVAVTAECRWSIPPEPVIEIVRDQEGIDGVLSSVSESTALPDGRVVQVHTIGWAIADRQVTLRFRADALPDGGIRVAFRRAREQQPLPPGRVQVALDRGWWEVHPDGRGGTHLRYQNRYDAGGKLKPWIVQKFQKAGVAQSVEEVRRAAALAVRRTSNPPVAAGPR